MERLLCALNLKNLDGSPTDLIADIKIGWDATTAIRYQHKKSNSDDESTESNDDNLILSDAESDTEDSVGTAENERKTEFSTREHIVVTMIVPIRLRNKSNGNIVWQNSTPNSTRFCRPIRLNFTKDTTEQTKEEKANLEKEISNFEIINFPNGSIECNFFMTMLDGKVKPYIILSDECRN